MTASNPVPKAESCACRYLYTARFCEIMRAIRIPVPCIEEVMMKITGVSLGIITIVLGILVLAWPDLIRWFVGIGLIVIGVLSVVRK